MPLVPISLQLGAAKTPLLSGMLDSGAALSLLDARWAPILGISDIEKGKWQPVAGVGKGVGWGFQIGVTARSGTHSFSLHYSAQALPYSYFIENFTWPDVMLLGHGHLAAWRRVTFDAAGQRSWTTSWG